MWYDVNKTLSHNCLFNFVIGPRGVGKTYSAKRRAIKNFITKDEQFVYLRRYDTELEGNKLKRFFNDICQEFPDHEFKYHAGDFYIDDQIAGNAMALSKAAQYKSTPFPRVSLIIFDEFIIDQGMVRYLSNEVNTFLEMYSTIARLRDVTVLFLANAITFTNPYFLYFDLKLQKGQKIYKRGDLLLEWVDNEEYAEAANKTRFGKILAGTDYAAYANNNEFLLDNDDFIEPIPGPSTCIMLMRVNGETFGVHSIRGSDIKYISDGIDKTCTNVISLDIKSFNPNSVMRQSSTAQMWYSTIKDAYMRAEVRFTSTKVKNLVTQAFKMY